MSNPHGFIKVEVPEGFLPQNVPVKEEERIPAAAIRVEMITKDDLLTIAKGLHIAFPDRWWSGFEPHEIRPSDEVRTRRFAKRLEAFVLNQPSRIHSVKAVDVATGELMGFAGWHTPVPQDDFIGMWTLPAHCHRGIRKQEGWSDEDVKEMFKGLQVDKYEAEFVGYDRGRWDELKGEPHWYLAPFYVEERFRGRGVGGVLMRYALDLADRKKQIVALESMPGARPVYMRFGFEPPKSTEKDREMLMIRWPEGRRPVDGEGNQ